jgi:hypothetical protein
MRFGRRSLVLDVLAIWAIGAALTLAAPVWLIIVGLLLCATAGLICQAVSTGIVAVTATRGASSAVGLYVTSFHTGGSVGAALDGVAWMIGGWPACVGDGGPWRTDHRRRRMEDLIGLVILGIERSGAERGEPGTHTHRAGVMLEFRALLAALGSPE